MSTEISRLKELMEREDLVTAAEIRPSDVPGYYLKNLKQIVHDFDFDRTENVTHFIITVRSTQSPAAVATSSLVSSDSLSSLVNDTLSVAEDLSRSRTESSLEKSKGADHSTEYLVGSAELLEQSGELELARNIYKNLIRRGDAIAEGLMGLGRTYEKEENLADAERHYREALAYSSAPEIYQSLCGVLIRLGKDDDASRYLIHATGLPHLTVRQSFDFHKSLGNCYARIGEIDKAANQYSKAYDIEPTSDALQVNVGSLALQKSDVNAAREHFKKALELNGKNEKAVNGLGMAALAAGETQKAHDYFIKSLDLDINNIGAIYNLVKTSYDLRTFEQASKCLERYMQLHPISRSNTNILYCYCGLLYHRGLYNTALEEAERILTLNPQHSGAKEIKALIKASYQGR